VDPQGIWWLDSGRHVRHTSELSAAYAALASGAIGWRDLPAYRFEAPLDRELRTLLPLMAHWDRWEDADTVREAA
jgi:hypothetical protein